MGVEAVRIDAGGTINDAADRLESMSAKLCFLSAMAMNEKGECNLNIEGPALGGLMYILGDLGDEAKALAGNLNQAGNQVS